MRESVLCLVAICLMSIVPISSAAQSKRPKRPEIAPIDQVVQITAQTQVKPPAITIHWSTVTKVKQCTVHRRAEGAGRWTQIAAPDSAATSITDTNVRAGVRYEYKILCERDENTAFGYVFAAIEAPLVDTRGKIVLLVDDTMAAPLKPELDRLIEDLTGDGWTVLRHDVPRTATPSQVKAVIKADYTDDPAGVKSVFILGHLPMFMSASINPDGHNKRPWPADAYYAGLVGNEWTDGQMTKAATPFELAVGRVDMSDLPAFAPLTEIDLMKRYLDKDHNYRHKLFAVQQKAIVDDNFHSYAGGPARVGWYSFVPIVGTGNVTAAKWADAVPTPYLWAYGCGPGSYTSCGGVVTTQQLTTVDPAVFTFLFGSYFGQWDEKDVLLRAELATPKYGLTCAWGDWPDWYIHHMALGETIGFSALQSENNGYTPGRSKYAGGKSCALQFGLMGDPTLRAFMIAPPGELKATVGRERRVDLSWAASAEKVLGYHVYRASKPSGPYTRLTEKVTSKLQFRDARPLSGPNYYMVRAIALQVTPSGSFYNASQGSHAKCELADRK